MYKRMTILFYGFYIAVRILVAVFAYFFHSLTSGTGRADSCPGKPVRTPFFVPVILPFPGEKGKQKMKKEQEKTEEAGE